MEFLVILKPDVYPDLEKKETILTLLTGKGLMVIYDTDTVLSAEQVDALYPHIAHEPYYQTHSEHMRSGPVLALRVVSTDNEDPVKDILDFKRICRNIYGHKGLKHRNAVHTSDSESAGAREIKIIWP